MSDSYVIVGDGIAGSSTAETIHEAVPDAEITMITDEGEALYNRILIKEFAKGKLPEAPISIHDQDWYTERDIELLLNTLVTDVNVDAHELYTHGGETIEYDKLLVATGGTPAQLPVENSDADGVHHFWTFQDARRIRKAAEAADAGVIIGAGLLGIDLAAICGAQGVDAAYLMRGDCWWRYALDADGGAIVHDAMREIGVRPVFESGADRFETDDEGHLVETIDTNGDRYPGTFAGVAIGLDFNTEFLQDAGVEFDDGIVVDEHMRTTAPDVYAAGDITRFWDTITDAYAQNGAWGSAKQQGAVAGANMIADPPGTAKGDPIAEDGDIFRWVSSYSITHFDFPFLSFGFPTEGDEDAARKYSDTEWRRLTFKDGKLIGGVLIGDLAPQSQYKQLIRKETPVADQKEILLEKQVDPEKLATTPT